NLPQTHARCPDPCFSRSDSFIGNWSSPTFFALRSRASMQSSGTPLGTHSSHIRWSFLRTSIHSTVLMESKKHWAVRHNTSLMKLSSGNGWLTLRDLQTTQIG